MECRSPCEKSMNPTFWTCPCSSKYRLIKAFTDKWFLIKWNCPDWRAEPHIKPHPFVHSNRSLICMVNMRLAWIRLVWGRGCYNRKVLVYLPVGADRCLTYRNQSCFTDWLLGYTTGIRNDGLILHWHPCGHVFVNVQSTGQTFSFVCWNVGSFGCTATVVKL